LSICAAAFAAVAAAAAYAQVYVIRAIAADKLNAFQQKLKMLIRM
jgi:hypothetical protein